MLQTIMIGVNDPNIAYLLQRYAEESGFRVAHTCQGDDLLDLVLRLQPALIILDIEFVEAVDWQIVRHLKAEPATTHIPIVIYSYLDELLEDWHEGVDGFLLKSVMYSDFVAMLKRALDIKVKP